jgi:hypothetical protein
MTSMSSPRVHQHRVWLVLGAVAVVVTTAGLVTLNHNRASEPSLGFWALMTSEPIVSGAPLFNTLSDLEPGSTTNRGFEPAEAIVTGTVVGVEPGIAYASGGDSTDSPIVSYDSKDAAFRWVVLDVQVDKVLAGGITGQQADGSIKIEMPQPAGVTLDDLKASYSSLGEGVYFVSNAYDLFKNDGNAKAPEVSPDYHQTVQRIIGEGVFMQGAGDTVEAPLMDDSLRNQVVGSDVTYPQLVKQISDNG